MRAKEGTLGEMQPDHTLLGQNNVTDISAHGRARAMLQEGLGEHCVKFALKEGVPRDRLLVRVSKSGLCLALVHGSMLDRSSPYLQRNK